MERDPKQQRQRRQQQQQQQLLLLPQSNGPAATPPRLPTWASAHEELLYLRSDCKLKDDTIKFLQREKERLQREVQHYEKLCAGVENEVFANTQSEAENVKLRGELDRAKETLRRQRLQIRALSSSSNGGGRRSGTEVSDDGGSYFAEDGSSTNASAQPAALGTSVCSRLTVLLRGACNGDAETSVSQRRLHEQLVGEAQRYGHVAATRPELCMELISLVDRALAELCELARRRRVEANTTASPATADIAHGGGNRPVLRYAYGTLPAAAAAGDSGDGWAAQTAYGQLKSEEVLLARRQYLRKTGSTVRSSAATARATTAPSISCSDGHSPAFVSLDRGTVLPGLKPVSAAGGSSGIASASAARRR